MIDIISPRTTKTEVMCRMQYLRPDRESGFIFDCTEDGTPILTNECQKDSYRQCLTGKDENGIPLTFMGVERFENRYVEPAVGRCSCGGEVELSGFTNTCERCSKDYNSSGAELAPREQWGEETGESLSDILMIP